MSVLYRGDVTKLDPFLNLVNTYMQGQLLFIPVTIRFDTILTENRRSRCTPNEHERAENRERYIYLHNIIYSGTSEQWTRWGRVFCPLVGGCSFFGGSNMGTRFVHCREVVRSSECPLLEVPLYTTSNY